MRSLSCLACAMLVGLLHGACDSNGAAPRESAVRSRSPYFTVKSNDPSSDALPLKSTRADVAIVGVIADVTVEQIYANAGTTPLEALYVFPASTRAAVHEMKMTIGQRTITAEIEERRKARETYEEAKIEGKTASLLEQQRPNVFEMNVANIMPGDEIKVRLHYTELLVPTDGVYEFVYPTVIGPRYVSPSEDKPPDNDRWTATPHRHAAEPPDHTFDIHVGIRAGVKLREVTCTSHKVKVDYRGLTDADVALDASDTWGGNRDFILRYRLTGERIETGLLLYKGEKENFFLLMTQPPRRVDPEKIPPREYIFVVDVSGSMSGFPLSISKQLLRDLILGLRPIDTFNVLLFSGSTGIFSDQSMPATEENLAKAVNLVERQVGGGGTELLPALRRALALPATEGTSRSIVVATDGYVSVEEEAIRLIRSNLGNANLFAFGIGTAVNRFLIESMSRAGCGEPFVVTEPDEAADRATAFRNYISTPVLTQVRCDFGGFDVYDTQPQAVPDILAERPVIVTGKWRGVPEATITVSGLAGKERHAETVIVHDSPPSDRNAALRSLWARQKVAELSDDAALSHDEKKVHEITTLGIEYQLLTPYTSFVAVDHHVRNEDGTLVTVKHPLPLPVGVTDLAVGRGLGAGIGVGYGTHGFGSGVSAFNFFGIRGKSDKVAVLIDVSARMLEKREGGEATFLQMTKRCEHVIDSLDERTLFSIVVFSEVAKTMGREMVIASPDNKNNAKAFIQTLQTDVDETPHTAGLAAAGGTARLDLALTTAFEQGADTILVVSDGRVRVRKAGTAESENAWWSIEDFEEHMRLLCRHFREPKGLRMPVVHTLGFMVERDDHDFLRELARRHNGSYRRVRALR